MLIIFIYDGDYPNLKTFLLEQSKIKIINNIITINNKSIYIVLLTEILIQTKRERDYFYNLYLRRNTFTRRDA